MAKQFMFKQSQKFRIISGNACFYTTAKQIRAGVGDLERFNDALQCALFALESMQANNIPPSGLSGQWYSTPVQIDKAN